MNFKFENLLGAPYRGGQILFDLHHHHTLLSPVGNRLQTIDLDQSATKTLDVEALTQISCLAMSPCGGILLMFDVEGRMLLINRLKERILHRMKFKSGVNCARFSPDGAWIGIGVGHQLQIWRRPLLEKQLTPMHLYRSYNPLSGEILCLDWSVDGMGIAVGCADMTTRIYTRDPVEGYKPSVLGGHRGKIVGVYFTNAKMRKLSEIAGESHDKGIDLITIGAKGQISEWSYERTSVFISQDTNPILEREEYQTKKQTQDSSGTTSAKPRQDTPEFVPIAHKGSEKSEKIQIRDWEFHHGRWIRCLHHSFNLGGKSHLTAVDFHQESGMMVAAFSNGIFQLIQFPGFHQLQLLTISQEPLTAVSFSPQGEWIAIGAAKLGQLLVWDWRTETHVLKQQGHFFDISALAYSPDGSILATGAEDSKLKIFSMTSGFCYVTFKEHLMPITAVQFLPNGNAVLTASLDGTVRAFDLVRYRNFRTFTSPDPVQFSCLAVDPRGDVICAGSQDSFQIHVWAIKTGRLLDILSAHEGPISTLHFNPVQPILASSSWDGTVKLWDVFSNSKGSTESLLHTHDVITFVFGPHGKSLAAACLDGSIHFWDTMSGEEEGLIEGRRDIARGRFQTDRRISHAFSTEAHFTTLAYHADGTILFAAGKSKFICLYDVDNLVLLRKIQTTRNKNLDGVLDMLNSRYLTEAGAIDLINDDDDESDAEDGVVFMKGIIGAEETFDLPGSQQKKKPIIQTRALGLSPTGRSFAAATTEGILIYSLDVDQHFFDPIDLAEDITPQAVADAMKSRNYLTGLIIALRLKEQTLVQSCLLCIPLEEVDVTVRQISPVYATDLLEVITIVLKRSPDLELLLHWARSCCTVFGHKLKESNASTTIVLKQLSQVLMKFQVELGSMVQSNLSLMKYISQGVERKKKLCKRSEEFVELDG